MRTFLMVVMMLLYSIIATAEVTVDLKNANIPVGAKKNLPLLQSELSTFWPKFPDPSLIAGQIEQESCVSLKSPKCWNERSELKTSREYGFGFGQITIAYKADGTERFNIFNDIKRLDPSLKAWKWEDRFDPARQLRTVVLMDRSLYTKFLDVPIETERQKFMLVCYNSGCKHVRDDQLICIEKNRKAGKKVCDPMVWTNNVEVDSVKSRKPLGKEYSRSAYEISREYPRTAFQRKVKYEFFFKK